MNPKREYDLAVIGSGPGGYVAGLYASRHNLKTCVIEKDLVGGTCLNRGCIPTKSMLNSSSILSKIKESGLHGIVVDGYKLDFSKVLARKTDVVTRLRAGVETLFRANKIELVKGTARLAGNDRIEVDGAGLISAKNIIIATGSRPQNLPNIAIDEVNIYSSDGIFEMAELPKSLLVVGGGVIGIEFATLFNSFGVKVTVVELLDRILPMQSRETSRKYESILKRRGVEIFTQTRVEGIAAGSPNNVRLSNNKEIDADKVLVSVGRKPAIDGIGLEKLRIATDNGRITVDEFLKTSSEKIYAIGDCINGPQLAHKASYDAILACDNILGKARKADYSNIPNCIWTDPEIASVGLIEEEAKQRCPDAKIAKFPYLASGKAFIMARPEGFIKMIGDREGRILGVEIFGEGACELIAEAGVARFIGMTIAELGMVVHGHPTLSEIYHEASHIFCGSPIHSV